MKMYKRMLALGLAVGLLLASLAGCSKEDTSWIAQYGEETVPVGVYMVEMMMGYNDAATQLPGSEDILKESIGETPAAQYISDFAKTECAKLLTIRGEFADRGLSLSAEEWDQSVAYTDYLYSVGESFYSANGVAKESVQYINDTTMMSLAIFNSIYGEGGEKEVPRADLEKEFANAYTRSQYAYIPKIDMTSRAALSEEDLAAAKEKAEAYLARAKAGEKLPDLYLEAVSELDPNAAAERMEDSYYDIFLEMNAGYFPPAYETAVAAAADNEVVLTEDDYYYYLIKKLPLMQGDPDTVEEHLSGILQTMKYDEYNDTITQWSQDIEVRYNTAALAAYTPSKLKMTAEQLAALAEETDNGEVLEDAGEDIEAEEGDAAQG